jgi:hypothetical protein
MNDSVLGSGAPATIACRLWLVAPALDGTGGVECGGNGYAKATLPNSAGNFPASVAGAKASAGVFAFPVPTGNGWGAAVAVSTHDDSNNDLIDLVVFANIPLPPAVIGGGDTVTVNAGDYTVLVQ